MATVISEEKGILPEERIQQVKAELRETDGEPLETPWHRAEINLLIDQLAYHLRGRSDYYAGGNMFIYYSLQQARKWEYRGPDFFFVKGVDGTRKRKYWWVFEEEGKFPDVVIELLSESTAVTDRTIKKELYEKTFRTPEYFCYDPETRQLEGWRLLSKGYQPILANERGWLWSEQLGFCLGIWNGSYLNQQDTWLRFFDSNYNLVPTEAESERQRAEGLQAELARTKALLAEKGIALSNS
jgi:Uma2 family endonuclease